ncbi:unnamed protein product [Ambrosiozyma monospora]|uniref:Unnamed protein product n=1 Tax=Ambrosiozyma monospora TaxID=43982 RepID=A0A9W7DDJ0_AMBMO|nr:unnamed protein product [Ambrosiozyma monospora]
MDSNNSRKRQFENGSNGKKKNKFGRKELRHISRTSRRDQISHEENLSENDHDGSDSDEYDHNEGLNKNTKRSRRSNHSEEYKLAYNALVTLLKHEHPLENKKVDSNEQDQDQDQEETAYVEKKTDTIEAFENDESEAEEEDENIKIAEDSSNSKKHDTLLLHFNDEELIEKAISHYESKKPKLKIVGRERYKDETYMRINYGYENLSSTISSDISDKVKFDSSLESYNIKLKVFKRFQELNPATELEKQFIDSMLQYQNINFQYYNLPQKIRKNYQKYYLLHIANHLVKSKDTLIHNNLKLKNDSSLECRDQGYTRPKVLVLLPTRNAAWELINKLTNLLGIKQVSNMNRFKKDFYAVNESLNSSSKPKEFKEFFKGNSNDLFNFGVRLNNSMTTVNLFSSPANSDLICASPLGLKLMIEKQTAAKFKEHNFLSSIEVVVMDKAEGFLMSNWSHVTELLSEYVNKSPTKISDQVDFSRVRISRTYNLESPFLNLISLMKKLLLTNIN